MKSLGLAKLKKNKENQKIQHHQNLVFVGSGIDAIFCLREILAKNPLFKPLVVRQNKIIDDEINFDLSDIRGFDNQRILDYFKENISQTIKFKSKNSEYLKDPKDLKFSTFKVNKGQYLKLNKIERYYSKTGYSIANYFENLTWKKLQEIYPQITFLDIKVKKIINNIQGKEEKVILEMTNDNSYICNKVIWADGAYELFSKLQNIRNFPNELIESFQSTKTNSKISIFFELINNSDAIDFIMKEFKEKTLFIALSLTNNLGYFIGEQVSDNGIVFEHFIQDDNIQKEDITKNIKILKRQLNKTFQDFSQLIKYQNISYVEQSIALDIKDYDYSNYLSDICLVGKNALLKDSKRLLVKDNISLTNICGVARSILSLNNIYCVD